MNKEELAQNIEIKMRHLVRLEIAQVQGRVFGEADLIILSSLGIDGSKKLAEILVEEAQKNLEQLNQT